MDNFVNLTTMKIAELISKAEVQVVYIAPAMEATVAEELVKFVKRTSVDQVAISLDLSTEVYREGFGDPEALETLGITGIRIKDIPGLRLGMLLIDDMGWIYSPISRHTLSNLGDFNKNALFMNNEFLQGYVITSIKPEQASIFDEVMALNTNQRANEEEANIIDEKIEIIKKNIEAQPLPNFDEQELLSAYRSLIQFIEITFSGARLEQKTVKLPSELLNVNQDKEFEEKMKANYRLFNEDISKHTKVMKEKIDRLRERYTYSLSRKYGRIILVEKKLDFEKDYQSLTNELEKYKESLIQYIDTQIAETKSDLIEYFTPVLRNNPPLHLRKDDGNPLTVDEIKSYINWLLDREFPNSQHLLSRVQLDYTYKAITEEIIKDKKFLEDLDKALKNEPIHLPHRTNQQESLLI